MAYPYEQDLNSARSNLSSASSYYQRSPQSFDNAAARVRNRINAQSTADQAKTSNQFQGRGLYNSNMQRSALQRDRNNALSTYSGALVDLNDQFEQRDLQRAQGLAGVGQQFGELGGLSSNYDVQTKQQELQKLLGLGSQEVEKRGQDINKNLQTSAQDIQSKLGTMNVLRDVLGSQYEFGNTRLSAGDQAIVDQITQYLLGRI